MLLLNIVLLAGRLPAYRQLNPTAEKDLISKQEAATTKLNITVVWRKVGGESRASSRGSFTF